MTLTFKTAKHAIDKHGEVFRIVEHSSYLTGHSVTRDRAKEMHEYDPRFKPCIVVTTAREALDAAWELAYETDLIPARTPYIFRAGNSEVQTATGLPNDLYAGHGKSRLIDPLEPEPWELARYCHANGEIYKRLRDANGVYWVRPGSDTRYYREHLIKLRPEPLTIEGEAE
ncbi:MAG: hypothetical protein E6Z13_00115 [Dermabacter sp.]|nr:hypothetical protein [Dermabacter sp.]